MNANTSHTDAIDRYFPAALLGDLTAAGPCAHWIARMGDRDRALTLKRALQNRIWSPLLDQLALDLGVTNVAPAVLSLLSMGALAPLEAAARANGADPSGLADAADLLVDLIAISERLDSVLDTRPAHRRGRR